MKSSRSALILLIILSVLTLTDARATSLRCGVRLHLAEVLAVDLDERDQDRHDHRRDDESQHPVHLHAAQEGEELVLTVRDRGPGVPEGQQEQIFQAFFTTRTRGTGLGLAVARRVAKLHGGSLSVTNHPQGGASFSLRLPTRPQGAS